MASIEPAKDVDQADEDLSKKLVAKELTFEETPLMGGTTTTQAAEDKQNELSGDQNKTILTHSKHVGDSAPSFGDTPLNAAMGVSDEPPKVDPFANTAGEQKLSSIPVAPLAPQSDESIIEAIASDTNKLNASGLPAPNLASAPNEPAPISAPLQPGQTLVDVENSVAGAALPMPPAVPDFGALPPLPPAPTGVDTTGVPQIAPLGVTPEPVAAPPISAMPTQPVQSTGEFNPAQFQIPGQK